MIIGGYCLNSRYKRLCKGLAIVIVVLGVICSIVFAVLYGEVKSVSYSLYSGVSTMSKRSGILTFVILFSGLLSTGVLYVIFASLGEMLEYLEILANKSERENCVEEELPPL